MWTWGWGGEECLWQSCYPKEGDSCSHGVSARGGRLLALIIGAEAGDPSQVPSQGELTFMRTRGYYHHKSPGLRDGLHAGPVVSWHLAQTLPNTGLLSNYCGRWAGVQRDVGRGTRGAGTRLALPGTIQCALGYKPSREGLGGGGHLALERTSGLSRRAALKLNLS